MGSGLPLKLHYVNNIFYTQSDVVEKNSGKLILSIIYTMSIRTWCFPNYRRFHNYSNNWRTNNNWNNNSCTMCELHHWDRYWSWLFGHREKTYTKLNFYLILGGICQFPFIFQGQTFTSCTSYLDDKPWCPTKVDQFNNFIAGNFYIELFDDNRIIKL